MVKECLIKAKALSKTYKLFAEEIGAVKSIDLEINGGDFIAIMGPSGSGKTTLLDILGCLDRPSSGSLEVFGKETAGIKEDKLMTIRRGNISFIFQEFFLIPSLTALENVELPVYFARLAQDKEKSALMLKKVGLGHRVNHLPKQMSGGEKQRVAIARALASSPKILFADEPTGNLDSKNSQEIFDIFKKLNKEDGLTIIVATHNENLGAQAGRTLRLRDGRIVN